MNVPDVVFSHAVRVSSRQKHPKQPRPETAGLLRILHGGQLVSVL